MVTQKERRTEAWGEGTECQREGDKGPGGGGWKPRERGDKDPEGLGLETQGRDKGERKTGTGGADEVKETDDKNDIQAAIGGEGKNSGFQSAARER